ncbi:hypothetical protein ACOMHN_025993 [Nucella lapillus]
MSPLPSAPWTELRADFGHLPNGQYILVVTDEYSRYVVVDIPDSTSAKTVIPRLERIFAEFGFPSVLKTDNGPPFNSRDFSTYASHSGFRHRKITPLCPRANGETERLMRTIKKRIKAATAQQKNWKQEMYRFLLDYRTTPHTTTRVAPATAIIDRAVKNRLPQLPPQRPDDAAMRRHDYTIGDPVLLKTSAAARSSTPYHPSPMTAPQYHTTHHR